jgi:hypothetical protein
LDRPVNNGSGSDNAPILQSCTFEYNRLCADPAPASNEYLAPLHRLRAWNQPMSEPMVAVCNINVRTDHVLIANLDETARVNHHISIEIIRTTNLYTCSFVVYVIGPQPTTLGKGIVITDADLFAAAHTTFAFHSIPDSLNHSEHSVCQQPDPAE